MTFNQVALAVQTELKIAKSKFPQWPTDPIHAVAIVAEEMGELQKEVLQLSYEPHKSHPVMVRAEAIQLVAMVFRFLQSIEDYEYSQAPQHSQEA